MSNEPRVIVRHTGPPGPGLPAGGTAHQLLAKKSVAPYDTEWVNPPNGVDSVRSSSESTNNEVALFDGPTGKKIKSSGILISALATIVQLANKVDKVVGKGLSSEDFTTALKSKLNNLAEASFRGSFPDLAAINAYDFSPAPRPGDYCLIEVSAEDLKLVFWDDTNVTWTIFSLDPVAMSGSEIATALFYSDDAAEYNQNDCRIFTSSEKAQLKLLFDALNTLTGGSGILTAYGTISYFNLTGTSIPIAFVSDGLTRMVKVDPATTLSDLVSQFDTGSVDGRLRYTGTMLRTFKVTARLSVGDAINDTLVYGIAKNGSVIATSRVLECRKSAGSIGALALSALVELTTNDYVEVFVGNTSTIADPTVLSMSLEALSL
jgi:hypothetical protein